MGVQGAHPFIKKKSVKFIKYDSILDFASSTTNVVYLDLFGCFFYKMKKLMFLGKKEAFLHYLISILKESKNIIVVFDGARSEQKLETSLNRLAIQEKAADKLRVCLEKSAILERLSKSHYRALEDLLLRAYTISEDNIKFLKEGLVSADIKILEAPMEADVVIAKVPNVIVISIDSDFYFHKNVKTFGKFTRSGIIAFEKKDILASLKTSTAQLVVLGK